MAGVSDIGGHFRTGHPGRARRGLPASVVRADLDTGDCGPDRSSIVGVDFSALLITYTAGMAAGSLLPLPAGLGAVETAMTFGLTVAGTAAAPALAAVLLYRLFFHRKRRRPRVAGGRGPTRTRRRSSPFSRHPTTYRNTVIHAHAFSWWWTYRRRSTPGNPVTIPGRTVSP